MVRLAERGDYFLGRWLDDGREHGVDAEFILTHSYKEIVAEAKKVLAKNELYRDWLNGSGYVGGADRDNYCPINHMQNSDDPERWDFQKEICKGVGYVCCYPECERYGCKEQCWEKYDELKKNGLPENRGA